MIIGSIPGMGNVFLYFLIAFKFVLSSQKLQVMLRSAGSETHRIHRSETNDDSGKLAFLNYPSFINE